MKMSRSDFHGGYIILHITGANLRLFPSKETTVFDQYLPRFDSHSPENVQGLSCLFNGQQFRV